MDIGEGFTFDDELLDLVSSANVCCGSHAGRPDLSVRTVEKCNEKGVRVGAHPGIPDRESMGRGPLPIKGSKEWIDLEDSVFDQVRFLRSLGAGYLKLHGELYNRSTSPGDACDLLERLLIECRLPLMGMQGTAHELCSQRVGVDLISEGFADRRYDSDGRLVSRSVAGAVLTTSDAVASQAVELARSGIDSICVHGDTEGCIELVSSVREALMTNGFVVQA